MSPGWRFGQVRLPPPEVLGRSQDLLLQRQEVGRFVSVKDLLRASRAAVQQGREVGIDELAPVFGREREVTGRCCEAIRLLQDAVPEGQFGGASGSIKKGVVQSLDDVGAVLTAQLVRRDKTCLRAFEISSVL